MPTVGACPRAPDVVRELCQRSMLLNEGQIVTMGDTEKVIDEYLAMLQGG
jgi:ABC-type polysaccharide/polyol phosphate transport system ATPase subunit